MARRLRAPPTSGRGLSTPPQRRRLVLTRLSPLMRTLGCPAILYGHLLSEQVHLPWRSSCIHITTSFTIWATTAFNLPSGACWIPLYSRILLSTFSGYILRLFSHGTGRRCHFLTGLSSDKRCLPLFVIFFIILWQRVLFDRISPWLLCLRVGRECVSLRSFTGIRNWQLHHCMEGRR